MTPALAEAFGGPVYGVEPSHKMRDQAVAHAGHPAVTYLAGTGEHIPLPDASCDAALLFFVWHHVVDREGAARALRRVVKPGGKLFVQVNFSDQMPDVWWFRVVPEWRKADISQFRSHDEVKRDFTDAGWTFVCRDDVTWMRSPTLAEDYERLKLRAVSLFERMSEDEIDAGFLRIEAELSSLDGGPQHETSAMFVLQRS
jgi:SAM-dependent methyltransferase